MDHPLLRSCLLLTCALVWVAAPEPALAQQAGERKGRQIEEAYHRAYRQENWPRAIELGLQLIELVPDSAPAAYNLACAYARHGDVDDACTWLNRAAENGFVRHQFMEADSDLDTLRDHDQYQAALKAARANHERLLARLKQKFLKRDIQMYISPTHDRSRPAPLLIVLHGHGGCSKPMAQCWRKAAHAVGAVLVAPEGVRPVLGAPGFTWGNMEEADAFVQFALEHAQQKYKIDPRRVIVTGFSQGGFVAFRTVQKHPDQFCGAIAVGAPYEPTLDKPARVTGGDLPRFYFMAGTGDPLAPETRLAARDFEAAGYPTRFKGYPSKGHTFPHKNRTDLSDALDFVLKQ